MSGHDLLAALIIAFAFFGESMFGFGGGLIAIPLLSVFLNVRDAVTLVLISQFCMGLLIWKTYKQVDWKVTLPMTASLVIGTTAGTLILSLVNPNLLRLILILTIVAFLVKTWFFNGLVISKRHKSIASRLAGLFGGLLSGLIGTGGPVLTMYLSVVIKQKAIMRASLIYLFFVTSVVRVAISIPQGLFTSQLLRMAAVVLPFFLVAIALGQAVHHKISETHYRQTINVLLLLSAILLVVKIV